MRHTLYTRLARYYLAPSHSFLHVPLYYKRAHIYAHIGVRKSFDYILSLCVHVCTALGDYEVGEFREGNYYTHVCVCARALGNE